MWVLQQWTTWVPYILLPRRDFSRLIRSVCNGCHSQGDDRSSLCCSGVPVELTKYLLKKGLNLNAKTKAGKTPLDLASNEEIRSLLLEHEKEAQAGIEKVPGQDKDAESDLPLQGKAKENEVQESNEENLKRKDEGVVQVSSAPKSKKSKVALSHLLASDDA